MNEFDLIENYFKKPAKTNALVALGIGDDAACLNIPKDQQLLVTTDTLVNNVHFLNQWDPFDIAFKAVMVNLSDIAAMGGEAVFASLALTLPEADPLWLKRFSEGLFFGLNTYNVALIGGDITKGPLTITLTVHGLVAKGKAISRKGAQPEDSIWVSGFLGGADLAVSMIREEIEIQEKDRQALMELLLKPKPRLDLAPVLKTFADAAIDISDGLGADLEHICEASQSGACLSIESIPTHPLVKKYRKEQAVYHALQGGDDYELCFTIPKNKTLLFQEALEKMHLTCYNIGQMQKETGLRIITEEQNINTYIPCGYKHF